MHKTIYILSIFSLIFLSCGQRKTPMTDSFNCRNALDTGSLKDHLQAHVIHLAEQIGPRNIGNQEAYDKLLEAAEYIKSKLREMGFEPNVWSYSSTYDNIIRLVENIEVVIKGHNDHAPIIIMGAHYDTVHESPGANDNGSGIAAILEIARYMKQFEGKMPKTLKLLCFPNEERPYSQDQVTKKSFGPNMGSMQYAQNAKNNQDNIEGAIALDAIGYFNDQPGSQSFPFLPRLFKLLGFSDKANFISFVSNLTSRSFLRKCHAAFHNGQNDFPTESLSLPDPDISWFPPLVGRSDHKSFWLHGFPAILITDTANFRNKHYHQPTDTSETVNYDQLTQVVLHLNKMAYVLLASPE